MEAVCVRHTELPRSTRLFTDFLYQYHRVEPFYTTARSTGYPEDRRPALLDALHAQNKPGASLDLLAQPGVVAVVTGQQVGLFSGPAYTIYKALTAAKVAKELVERGTPAVPVFWLATEDHDFAEVKHAWTFNSARQPLEIEVLGVSSNGRPVGEVAVQDWPLEQLRLSLEGFPFGPEVFDLVRDSYVPGATMGQAFRHLLERILEPYNFVFIDPLHPAVRKLAAPLLRNAVELGPELNDALLRRNRELEAAGYHAQVHVDARTSLVFLLEGERRVALRDLRYSADELASRADQLSPNALLRPVVQDYLLPTAAYVGGPAELAYFAQSQVLYERLLGHMPRLISRSGFTLLDARSLKLMQRYHLELSHFFEGQQALNERIAAQLIPPSLVDRFESANQASAQLLTELRQSVSGFEPTLGAMLDKSKAKILHQLSKAQGKVAREVLRRDHRALSEASFLYNGIFPEKHLQERLYGILPFLAQHGMGLMDEIYENVRLDCPDHLLLPV